ILCNDAKLEFHSDESGWHIHGDPTEGALLCAAARAGMSAEIVRCKQRRIMECPFSSLRKRMTPVHDCGNGTRMAYVKGSVESVLAMSSDVYA
ncbi:hypothetical protein ABTN11_20100, partial [Acinetobacter baumannii]